MSHDHKRVNLDARGRKVGKPGVPSVMMKAQMIAESGHTRFEDQIRIEISCCHQLMVLCGNLSLRGAAGADETRLAYECKKCFRRVQVVDDWGKPTAEQLAIYDETP